MNGADIAVIVIVGVAFLGAIGYIIYKKLKGKSSGCGCGCDGCPHSCSCKSDKK